ncbi:odorant receptor 131-2-like [Engraulis encrasicolus]|uniref:odorant receptor 131-2-like n=1 Tax=Engraulis encrasicolus TaxID=184585 RepID=UPI002FD03F57
MNNQSIEEAPLVHQQIYGVNMSVGPMFKLLVTVHMCMLFIYINSVMFYTVLSKPVFRELPRYVLFAFTLCNDSMQLLVTMLLYLLMANLQAIPIPLCALLSLIAEVSFYNAALNLAVMSLERYVAICFPLRHSEIVNQKSAGISMGLICCLSSINIIIDIIHLLIKKPASFKNSIYCTRERLILSRWQLDMSQGLTSFFFVAVTCILIFTYINVVLVARSASSQKDSAKKAHQTILLHFGQLVLCVNSFIYGTIERALYMASSTELFLHLRYLNFLFVLLLPRCLSPLVYGLRDDALRPLFFYYVRCGTQKVKPSVNTH